MLRTEKQETIDLVKGRFEKMVSAVFVDYQGLDVASVTALRDQLRKADVEYKVVKNTLTRLAVKDQGYAEELAPTLTGMTAIAWSYEDPSAAAKVLKAFQKDNEKLKIKAGLIDGKVIDEQAVVNQLAVMPGKDELRAKLLATLQAPAQQFVQQLQAPAQNFVYLLTAKEKDGGAAA
ncbi:MAG: 50S ribosomal protein L10 [Myxococcales bacterium]|nr:50S ribosomal protein L10 [Myxococcales bacterium]